jgi:hypothetical protein
MRFDGLNSNETVSISPVFWIPDKIGKLNIVKGYLRAVFLAEDGARVEFFPLGLVNFPSRLEVLHCFSSSS